MDADSYDPPLVSGEPACIVCDDEPGITLLVNIPFAPLNHSLPSLVDQEYGSAEETDAEFEFARPFQEIAPTAQLNQILSSTDDTPGESSNQSVDTPQLVEELSTELVTPIGDDAPPGLAYVSGSSETEEEYRERVASVDDMDEDEEYASSSFERWSTDRFMPDPDGVFFRLGPVGPPRTPSPGPVANGFLASTDDETRLEEYDGYASTSTRYRYIQNADGSFSRQEGPVPWP